MADVKWSEFASDPAAQPDDSEVMLLRGGQNVRAPGVNWKGDKGDPGNDGAQGPQGPKGDTGATGATGNDGADGADGNTVLSAARNPTAGDGVDGDFWINTSTWDIFGPKTTGAWGPGTSLIGPQGAQGNDGAAGADGMTVLNGSGVPGAGLGKDGDFYIDTDVWDIYGPKTAGVWGAGTSLIGPEGPKGDPGTGYILQGSATVATLNALDANLIGDSYAWIMLDSGTLQPVNGVGSTPVVTDDLVVWAAPSLAFVNYGNQSGGGGGDVSGPASSVDDNITAFDGVTGKLIKDTGVGIDKVNSALQPGDNVSDLVNDAGYSTTDGDVVGPPSAVNNRLAAFDGVTGKLIKDSGSVPADFATAAQGALADSALQSGDNVSELVNDAGYGTGDGDVSGPASAVDNNLAAFDQTTGKLIKDSGSAPSDFATAAQGATADTATQPGDNLSTLTNDENFRPIFSGASLPPPAGYNDGDFFAVIT